MKHIKYFLVFILFVFFTNFSFAQQSVFQPGDYKDAIYEKKMRLIEDIYLILFCVKET